MPKIKDIKPHLGTIIDKIRNIDGISSVYVWGSYAENIKNEDFRVKDIDIIAKTNFHSGDLISINSDIIEETHPESYYINEGYDIDSIKFSSNFLNFNKYNIDHWAVSKDNRLLHWGAFAVDPEESKLLNKEAEKFASNNTGYNRERLNKTSNKIRYNWYNHYSSYINNYFSEMPSGWYQSEEENVSNLLKKAMKI